MTNYFLKSNCKKSATKVASGIIFAVFIFSLSCSKEDVISSVLKTENTDTGSTDMIVRRTHYDADSLKYSVMQKLDSSKLLQFAPNNEITDKLRSKSFYWEKLSQFRQGNLFGVTVALEKYDDESAPLFLLCSCTAEKGEELFVAKLKFKKTKPKMTVDAEYYALDGSRLYSSFIIDKYLKTN
jgi:hypothetical protein